MSDSSSASTWARDPTERARHLEKLTHEKPAEIVGRLAATEDALLRILKILDRSAENGARVHLAPELALLQTELFETGRGLRGKVPFRIGYERQIAMLHTFA